MVSCPLSEQRQCRGSVARPGTGLGGDPAARGIAEKCYKLLETLAQTVRQQCATTIELDLGGTEDRRTKLGFIVLGQNTIKAFAAALLSGISPIIIHAIDKSGMFDP